MKKIILLAAIAAITGIAQAAPSALIIMNNISSQSNASIRGVFTKTPIAAYSIANFPWSAVQSLCDGVKIGAVNVCATEIYAQTENPNPIDVGTVVINLSTGKLIALNQPYSGYKITIDKESVDSNPTIILSSK